METITVRQAAEKWGISDRRVRVLCSQGKIPGAVKQGKSYKIPAGAVKPADGRERLSSSGDGTRYLKWDNEIVGVIDNNNTVSFTAPEFNEVLALYTHGRSKWAPEEFNEFLAERVVSRDRRDIERILSVWVCPSMMCRVSPKSPGVFTRRTCCGSPEAETSAWTTP